MEEIGPTREEPTSWEDLFKVNLVPSELFLKFRKEIEGFRVGVNLEFYNNPSNEYLAKVSSQSELVKALLATEAGTKRDELTLDATTGRINSLLFKVRSLRMCGSCALNLCGVACGRLDLFYELEFGGPCFSFCPMRRGSLGSSLSALLGRGKAVYILPSPDPTWWEYTG